MRVSRFQAHRAAGASTTSRTPICRNGSACWKKHHRPAIAASNSGRTAIFRSTPNASARRCKQRGLNIIAGDDFDDLVAPANLSNLLQQTDNICRLITQLPRPEGDDGARFPSAPYLVVMDWGTRARLQRRAFGPRAASHQA